MIGPPEYTVSIDSDIMRVVVTARERDRYIRCRAFTDETLLATAIRDAIRAIARYELNATFILCTAFRYMEADPSSLFYELEKAAQDAATEYCTAIENHYLKKEHANG